MKVATHPWLTSSFCKSSSNWRNERSLCFRDIQGIQLDLLAPLLPAEKLADSSNGEARSIKEIMSLMTVMIIPFAVLTFRDSHSSRGLGTYISSNRLQHIDFHIIWNIAVDDKATPHALGGGSWSVFILFLLFASWQPTIKSHANNASFGWRWSPWSSRIGHRTYNLAASCCLIISVVKFLEPFARHSVICVPVCLLWTKIFPMKMWWIPSRHWILMV